MPADDRPVYLTKEGLARIEAELEELRTVKRPEIAERIHDAKRFSSASDQAEYEDARNEQAQIESRIMALEDQVRRAHVIDEKNHSRDLVSLGSTVTVRFGDGGTGDYTLVGRAEANPAGGRISNESPVGQALLGRRVGETVQVMAPGGVTKMTIENIA